MLSNIFRTITPVLFYAAAHVAHAQYYKNPITIQGASGKPIETIPEFLLALVDIVFLFGMPIIVLFIIYGGFLFVTAGDNEAQITKARRTILWTLVGAGVLIGAKVIAMAIQATVLSLGQGVP